MTPTDVFYVRKRAVEFARFVTKEENIKNEKAKLLRSKVVNSSFIK
jgi:hypothetical protein